MIADVTCTSRYFPFGVDMGLDTVELAMEVEESFGITIPDGHACQMRTVGDLYLFILEETRDHRRGPDSCLTAATFYALRRCLASHIDGGPPIRPRCDVDATLPRRKRQILWESLAHEMDLRFPRLRRPSWMVLLNAIAVTITTFAAYTYFVPTTGQPLAVFLALIMLGLTAAIVALITAPFALFPADSFRTYRGLVNQLLALNYLVLSERYESWNPTDVWNVLQLIIVEQLSVKKEHVTPDANFVYDLGSD